MNLLKKVKISLLISIGIMFLLSIRCFAVTGTITEITVNLRKEPSTDSKKIKYVTQDDVVDVLEKVGEWYKIKVDGVTGYVFGEYVKVDDSKLEIKEENTIDNAEEKEIKEENKNEESRLEEEKSTNLIIKSKTQIRIIPSISSNVIYTSSKNIQISIIEQLNNWTYISTGTIVGWVRTDKIIEENEVLPDKKEETQKEDKATNKEDLTKSEESKEIKTAYIKYDTVNLRESASTTAKVLAKLKLNDEITVIDEDNKWSKVKVDEKTGYILSDLLSDKKQEVKENTTKKDEEGTTSRNGGITSRKENETSKKEETIVKEDITKQEEVKNQVSKKITGEEIVAYAKKYLGYKYVLGGASPKSGFDCSGFTYYVYKNFGYTISRTSKTQIKDGTEVKKSELKPGDLLIFKNQSLTAIGHVGIYIGDNKMIHSSEPGVGVVITDLDASGYNYNKRYVTARRIIK